MLLCWHRAVLRLPRRAARYPRRHRHRPGPADCPSAAGHPRRHTHASRSGHVHGCDHPDIDRERPGAHALARRRRLVGPGPACARRGGRFAVGTFFAAAISGKAMLTTSSRSLYSRFWRTVSAPATTHAQDDLPCLPEHTAEPEGAGIGILSSLSVSEAACSACRCSRAHSIETRDRYRCRARPAAGCRRHHRLRAGRPLTGVRLRMPRLYLPAGRTGDLACLGRYRTARRSACHHWQCRCSSARSRFCSPSSSQTSQPNSSPRVA